MCAVRPGLAVPLLLSVVLASGCAGPGGEPAAPGGGAPASPTGGGTAVENVTTSLTTPWSVTFHGRTVLVSERDTGRVVELLEGGRTREVGTVPGVVPDGEGGLLGLAVRGDWLYAYSTGERGNRIQRLRLDGAAGSLRLGRATTLLDGIPKARYHNGGRIAFGPDGMLYAGTGDGGDKPAAQDRASLAGKILRMTPEGKRPSDNPFPGSLVYSYGHRNVQGLAWTPDGRMLASEFGQNTWDELNVITAGRNYGWPTVEGIGRRPGLVDPVQVWGPAEASPSGITVLGDRLYVACLRGQRLRVVPVAHLDRSDSLLVEEHGRLRDVVATPDGSLLVLTSNTDGKLDPRAGDDRVMRLRP